MYFFFFFQAEDGIRDVAVTGVQTCALPISLSSSDSLRNGRGIWKVRANPRRQITCAGCPAISAPPKTIEPLLGRSAPAIRLKIVLLPEPLGPMRPRISPCRTSNDTWLTARKPPKRFDRALTASTFLQARA